MSILILGLLIFLGTHSLRVYADDWRSRQLARFGEKRWKGVYALVSLLGLALIVWGFGLARQQPVPLYVPVLALRHLNALFTLVAFVLIVAAYMPRNHFRSALGHPMLAGVALWALGHLLATGRLHDVVLFGAFLCWAVMLFVLSRQRDRAAGKRPAAGRLAGDVASVAIGVVAWAAFAHWLHLPWIGVPPFG